MEFGFCTYFASKFNQHIDYELLKMISQAGFDFVELPLFQIESQKSQEFDKLRNTLSSAQLSCQICANLFPDDMVLTGPEPDAGAIQLYLSKAFSRAEELGVKNTVFASVPAWQTPKKSTKADGIQMIVSLISQMILPEAEKHQIKILIEPLRNTICDLVTTLSEAMLIVNQIKSPNLKLMADLYHLEINDENPEQISRYSTQIEHIHVAQPGRHLPTDDFSPTINVYLDQLNRIGYHKTISFETLAPIDLQRLKSALRLLKSRIDH